MKPVKKIVVGIDFSEATEPVVQAAIEMGRKFEAAVDLVHVHELFAYPVAGSSIPTSEQNEVVFDWIDESLSRLGSRLAEAKVPSITTSLQGSPATEIVIHARKTGADMILVGTHGRGGLSHAVLGSVAERVVQKAQRPVLVVPVGPG